MVTDSKCKKVLKPEIDWSTKDDHLANYNQKALHAIFNRCDADYIKLISLCETTKETWWCCVASGPLAPISP